MAVVLTAPAAPDPDDRDDCDARPDYVTEDELRALGIDPALVAILCPHATELRALDGARCWSRIDLTDLLDQDGGA